MFIDETTSREDLIDAVESDLSLVDHFIQRGLDPVNMNAASIREQIVLWIESGDECAAA